MVERGLSDRETESGNKKNAKTGNLKNGLNIREKEGNTSAKRSDSVNRSCYGPSLIREPQKSLNLRGKEKNQDALQGRRILTRGKGKSFCFTP